MTYEHTKVGKTLLQQPSIMLTGATPLVLRQRGSEFQYIYMTEETSALCPQENSAARERRQEPTGERSDWLSVSVHSRSHRAL